MMTELTIDQALQKGVEAHWRGDYAPALRKWLPTEEKRHFSEDTARRHNYHTQIYQCFRKNSYGFDLLPI